MALHTIVLRFSNAEYETVGEHLKIIDERGGLVWWGWWKKREERWQEDALRELATVCPREIGLVDRLAKRYYSATCEEIAIGNSGLPFLSPNPENTPPYYQGSEHPAWFRFSAITAVSEASFIQRFGGIPKGDPTLYIVEQGASGLRLRDQQFVEPPVINTPGESILHLSDLHFGKDHAFEPETIKTPFPRLSLADKVEEVVSSLSAYRIGVVVVSGDLLTEGESKGFDVAELFLSALLPKLGLEKEHVVIVPGNHDIYVKDYQEDAYRYDPEVGYKRFIRGYLGREDIEGLQYFKSSGGWQLRFLSLNSARLREKSLMNYGFVGRDRYEPLLKILDQSNDGRTAAELAQDRTLNFAVLHHHILPVQGIDTPPKNEPVSLTVDAGQLIANLQASKTHFVLHGHQHEPFLGTTARRSNLVGEWLEYSNPLVVVGCGSTGAKSYRLPDVLRNNSLAVYTPGERDFEIRIEQFNPTIPPQSYIRVTVPIRSPVST